MFLNEGAKSKRVNSQPWLDAMASRWNEGGYGAQIECGWGMLRWCPDGIWVGYVEIKSRWNVGGYVEMVS